jgi:hypothetical protein
MRNTMLLTDAGLRNLATKSVAYSLQEMGKEKGPPSKRTGKKTNLNSIQPGEAPAGPDIIKFKQDGEDYWQQITSQGTPFEGIPAEMLVQSLEGSHAVLTGMSKVAGAFGTLLRSGVTRTPAYILRQLIRDPMSASFTAGINRGPLAATLESMREFVSQSRGQSATGTALLRKGVTQSGIFNGTADDMHKIALQLAGGDQSVLKRLFAGLDRAAMRADAATRAQVYNDVLKKTGSEMEAELAAVEMMNFTKRGAHPAVQYATRMIPFMNAQIQALSVLAKAFRGNATLEDKLQIKEKFLKNAAGLAAFSLLYAAGMEDDPDYKKATAQERMNNFFVPNPFGPAWKIPIPYEVGFLFKALPEMILRGLEGKLDPTDWEAFRGSLLNIVPGGSSMGMPQAISPLVHAAFNKDAFLNDIDPADQKDVPKELRSKEGTTELAKAFSGFMAAVLPDSLVLSGPKAQELVRSYVGSMPIALWATVEQFLSSKALPDRMASQNPLWGSFVAKDVGTGPVASAYAAKHAVGEAEAGLAKLREDGETAAADAFEREHAGALSAKDAAAEFQKAMKGIKDERKAIVGSTMTGPEKREAVNALSRRANEVSEDFTKQARALATS